MDRFVCWLNDLLWLPTNIRKLVKIMSDQSGLLNEVAQGLTTLGGAVSTLVAENTSLRARNAELEGEDAAESSAATNVKSAYDELAAKFTQNPETPDVDPLPEDPDHGELGQG